MEADYATIKEKNMYRTRAIITRYILNPLFEVQKRFFKDVFRKILPLCMVSIKERFLTKSGLWWRAYGKYDNYEELVKDHYYVVPMAHETMGSWAPNSLKFI